MADKGCAPEDRLLVSHQELRSRFVRSLLITASFPLILFVTTFNSGSDLSDRLIPLLGAFGILVGIALQYWDTSRLHLSRRKGQ